MEKDIKKSFLVRKIIGEVSDTENVKFMQVDKKNYLCFLCAGEIRRNYAEEERNKILSGNPTPIFEIIHEKKDSTSRYPIHYRCCTNNGF